MQLTEVMDTHFSTAVPVMLHDERDSTLIRSIWKEISRDCSVLGRKTTASLVCSNQTAHQTRSGELENSENPLITWSDNAFFLNDQH